MAVTKPCEKAIHVRFELLPTFDGVFDPLARCRNREKGELAEDDDVDDERRKGCTNAVVRGCELWRSDVDRTPCKIRCDDVRKGIRGVFVQLVVAEIVGGGNCYAKRH